MDERIIENLKYYNKIFPRATLKEVISNKEEYIPVLLNTLDEINKDPGLFSDNGDYMLHLYALYLLAQFREKRAFSKIIKLISGYPDEVDSLLGDTITDGLSSILYSVYDGNINDIYRVIENPDIDEYVRGAVMDLYMKLYTDSLLEHKSVVDYLRNLVYKNPSALTCGLATNIEGAVIDNHLFEMIPDVQYLYDEELIDESMFGKYDEFIDLIYDYSHEWRDVEYISDTISQMEWWACFEQTKDSKYKDQKHLKNIKTTNKTELANFMLEKNIKIGRNDPCTCGSGLKFKFCCSKKPLKEDNRFKIDENRDKWLKDYPEITERRKEGQVLITDDFDTEAIEIDKSVYLALHHRAIPIWMKEDRYAEAKRKIFYLLEASEKFITKCDKEKITSFESYDNKYKIHYRSKNWMIELISLLEEYKEIKVEIDKSLLKKVKETFKLFN